MVVVMVGVMVVVMVVLLSLLPSPMNTDLQENPVYVKHVNIWI